MLKILAGALISAFSVAPAYAACHIEPYRFFFGSDTSTTGTVTGGSICTLKPGASAGAGFSSITITQPAAHGVAATNGSTVYPEVTYRPKPGYKGTDEFTFTIAGGGRRLQGTSNIRVTMTVQ